MITVKLNDLLNATDALRALSEKDMKAKLSYDVAKLLKAADAEMTSFNDTRMTLIKKYGNKDEQGELITDDKGNVKINNEFIDQFTSELNELLETEVELSANKIKLSALEALDFSPTVMMNLEAFIEDDAE